MPKATATKSYRKNTVIARNEPLGLLERINLSPDTRAKFAEVGKRKPNPRPVTPPPVLHRHISKEEGAELIEEFMAECAEKALVSYLVRKRNRLEDRIAMTDPVPLIDRIEPVQPTYTAPAPPPKDLHFQKKTTLTRKEEVWKVMQATKKRTEPVLNALNATDKREDQGRPVQVTPETRDKCWVILDRFEDIYRHFDVRVRKWDHGEWRHMVGACKRIGRIKLNNFSTRFPEICKELADSNVHFPATS